MESIAALLGEHVKLHVITDAVGNWAQWTAAEALERVAAHGALLHVHMPEHTDSHGETVPAGTYALTLVHVIDPAESTADVPAEPGDAVTTPTPALETQAPATVPAQADQGQEEPVTA